MKKRQFFVIFVFVIVVGIFILLYTNPQILNAVYSKTGIGIALGISIVTCIASLAISFSVKPPSLENIYTKRKRKVESNEKSDGMIDIEDLYVVMTHITSSYNDYSGGGPRYVTLYFLARLENDNYYELFAGKKLEKEKDTHKDGIVIKSFDIPYIETVKSLKEYLKDENQKNISIQSLFDFIVNMNVLNALGAFEDDEISEETVE